MTHPQIIQAIKSHIKSKQLTYEQVGESIGMSKQQVYNILNCNPRLDTLIRVAKGCGMEIEIKEK